MAAQILLNFLIKVRKKSHASLIKIVSLILMLWHSVYWLFLGCIEFSLRMPHFWPNKSHNDCDKMSAVATALTVYIGYARETLAAYRPSNTSVAIGRDVSRVCGINSRAL